MNRTYDESTRFVLPDNFNDGRGRHDAYRLRTPTRCRIDRHRDMIVIMSTGTTVFGVSLFGGALANPDLLGGATAGG